MLEEFNFTTITLIPDSYDGITIDTNSIPYILEEFEKELQNILQQLENKKLLWVKLPIAKSHFIPLLTKYDFIFHHCNEADITLLKKLTIDPIIPTARNHTLGVGVVVIDEGNILVVKERIGQHFKLPGGYIDDNENISTAVVREVKEETGIDVKFNSIIALGHFNPLQFGESNLYIGTIAHPLSKDINIIDTDEILEAKWMKVEDFLEDEEIYLFNKTIVNTALKNNGLKFEHIEMLKGRDIDYELFF